jgi:hypothetical protein
MSRFKVLTRIEVAIKSCNKADLDWADFYCTLRMQVASNSDRQKYWLDVLQDVHRAQMRSS